VTTRPPIVTASCCPHVQPVGGRPIAPLLTRSETRVSVADDTHSPLRGEECEPTGPPTNRPSLPARRHARRHTCQRGARVGDLTRSAS
jgi:hypothetical protein